MLKFFSAKCPLPTVFVNTHILLTHFSRLVLLFYLSKIKSKEICDLFDNEV